MSRSNVPKFGNWESEDNVPYTVYFDKARKTKGGKMINPNDPQENPEMFENIDSSPLAPASAHVPPSRPRTRLEEPIVKGVVKPSPEHGAVREDVDFRQSSNPPARYEHTNQKAAGESNYGTRKPKQARPSAGSEQSFDRSPLHPHQQAKVGGRVGGPQGWEGKTYEGSQGTAGKSRMRQANLGDDSPDKAAAVPRFGDWENDPQAAENFTDIFQKVREERNAGPGNVSTTPKHPSHPIRGQPSNQPKKCCCPWW